MQNRKLIYGILLFLLFIVIALGFIIFSLSKNNGIEITFLDVGQGDAILIEEGSNQVLIDGGRSKGILLEKLGENMPFWDRKIETIIITHPDTDHYGGLVGALDNYQIKNIIKTDAEKDGKEWEIFKEKINNENVESVRSIYDLNIVFSNGARLKTIYPFEKIGDLKDSNARSVVMRLDFGENSFLFTGDLPNDVEKILSHSGIDIDVDFLKIAHHGSKNSSSEEFLEKVNPKDAIISVGKNSYGHPHKEVLGELKNRLIRTWRTDEDGDIVYNCKSVDKKCKAFAN